MNKHIFKISIGDDKCKESINTLEISGTYEYAIHYVAGYIQSLKDLGRVLGPHNNVIPVEDVSMIHVDYVDPLKVCTTKILKGRAAKWSSIIA